MLDTECFKEGYGRASLCSEHSQHMQRVRAAGHVGDKWAREERATMSILYQNLSGPQCVCKRQAGFDPGSTHHLNNTSVLNTPR